jgi:hypothetical protein
MSKALNALNKLISILDYIIKEYEWSNENVNECDKETQDILHEIELAKGMKHRDKDKWYEQLRNLRKRRRTFKNNAEEFKELYEYIKSLSKGDIRQGLTMFRSRIEHLAKIRGKEEYNPKVRNDLTCTNKKPYNTTMQDAFKKSKT